MNKKQITLNIEGMHCASCSSNVEKTISKLKGIASANVNIATNKGTFIYNENEINLSTIKVICPRYLYQS